MKDAMRIGGSVALMVLGASLVGCTGSGGVKELAPDRFYRPQPPGTDESRHVLADRPGVLYNDVHMDMMDKSPQDPLHLKEAPAAPPPSVTEVSGAARELAAESTSQPAMLPSTSPSAMKSPASPPATRNSAKTSNGSYMTVGAVLVEVNGEPIYADKVVRSLEPVFSAEARQRDVNSFRAFAETEIRNQVFQFVNDELIYAQADHTLDQQEKALGNQLTMRWREQQVTQAGGSIEQARAKFAADGVDFDQALKDKYRQNITAIYIEKKIRPKVQVTAEDMRRYYDMHFHTEFSDPDSVQYRLITISVVKSGSRTEALNRIKDISDKAKRGEDFQSLASQNNDDARLARSGGLESPIQRGALRNEKLEAAVFSTPQGQLTDIIDGGDSFYIAKIENIKTGRVQPFDDANVQKSIREALSKSQMEPLITRERQKMLANSVMVPDPPLLDPAIEIAMQKYALWSTDKNPK